jgi:gluconolactonase
MQRLFPVLTLVLAGLTISHAQRTKDFTAQGEFTKNCEGPAVDSDGRVYAVNFAQDGTIAQIDRRGNTSFFITLPKNSTGNGIRFGAKNTFYIADFTGHKVLKADLETREVTEHVHEARMNQPNDLAITTSGHIFCSDPNWEKGTGQIWHITPDGSARLVAENLGTTNGIEVSPDEKKLYVNESTQRNVWSYDLAPDGSLSNKNLLITFPDGMLDGMRCDVKGNLYITRYGKGEVAIVSPKGQLLSSVQTKGKNVSNICFGGPNGKTAYVTLQDRGCLEKFNVKNAGREWAMMKSFAKKKK